MQIHLVVSSEGSHDDYSESVLKAFMEVAHAEAYIVKMKEQGVRYNEMVGKVRNGVQAIRERFPMARSPYKQPPKSPSSSGLKKKDWPQSYWDAYADTEAYNKIVMAKHHDDLTTWNAACVAAMGEMWAEIGATEEEIAWFTLGEVVPWYPSNHDYSYNIEVTELE